MEAEHVITFTVAEVFEGLKWKERMKVGLYEDNEVALLLLLRISCLFWRPLQRALAVTQKEKQVCMGGIMG